MYGVMASRPPPLPCLRQPTTARANGDEDVRGGDAGVGHGGGLAGRDGQDHAAGKYVSPLFFSFIPWVIDLLGPSPQRNRFRARPSFP